MTEPIISVDNIHKSYLMGKEAAPALRGVSLDIEQGDFVCLMGPSGSGKTTLLTIIGGLDEPSRGHVTIDGENLVALSENKLAGAEMRVSLRPERVPSFSRSIRRGRGTRSCRMRGI